jgi:nucleoside-diphosphate-sugar epimerase
MKMFVAGGTGAIGRPLIAALLAKGHAVVAFRRKSSGFGGTRHRTCDRRCL